MFAVLVAVSYTDLEISAPKAVLAPNIRLRVLAATAVFSAIVAVETVFALLALFGDELAATTSRTELPAVAAGVQESL